MSAQEIRESLEKGDVVHVMSNVGGNTRRRAARVISVMRMAAKVRFDDGKETVVRFCDLEFPRAVPAAKEPPKPRVATPVLTPASLPQAPKEVAAPAPTPAVAVPPTAGVKPAAPDIRRDLEAWRSMGRELAENLGVLNAELLSEIRALREERDAIDSRIEDLEVEIRNNNADLERLKGR